MLPPSLAPNCCRVNARLATIIFGHTALIHSTLYQQLGKIPKFYASITTTRCQMFTVGAKGDRVNSFRVAFPCGAEFATRYIPNSNRSVAASRCEYAIIGIERHGIENREVVARRAG